ncbi:MAG: response regulator [candidate division KSB1 bacterium]|nr:response regulator [candidate division KSB1 bacterium]
MVSSNQKPRLLIVDDDKPLLQSWQRALSRDFDMLVAANASEARELFQRKPDLALIDIRLDEADPNNRDGVELLETFLALRPDIPIVMTSAYGDIDIAVQCMRRGAFDFFKKPSDLKEIRQRLFSALQHGKENARPDTLMNTLSKANRLRSLAKVLRFRN